MDNDVDTWAAAGTQQLQRDTTEQLRSSVQQALPVSPDKFAEVKRYAAAANVPIQTAQALPDATKVQAQMASFDADTLAQKFPNTAQFLTDPNNAKLAHDDIPNTALVEQHVRALATPPAYPFTQTFASPADPTYAQQIGSWVRDKLGMDPAGRDEGAAARAFLDVTAQKTGTTRQGLREAIGGMSPIPQQFGQGFFDSFFAGLAPDSTGAPDTAGGGVARGAGGLAGFLLGLPLKAGAAATDAVLGSTIKHVAGESFLKATAKDALGQAATLGVASGIGAAGSALDQSSAADAARVVGKAALGGAVTGTVFGAAGRLAPDSTPAQAAARFVGISAALDAMNGQSPVDDRPIEQKVFDYGMNAFFSLHGAGRVQGGWLRDTAQEEFAKTQQAAQTEAQSQQLVDLAQAASASKLRERDPDAFKQFVKATADNGDLQGVYVDSAKLLDVLKTAGVSADELNQTMPEVARQFDEQLTQGAPSNGLVQIPIEDFATHIAGGPLEKPLMEHLRVSPEGGTVGESKAFLQSQLDDMKATADKIAASHADDQAYQASTAKVQADIQQRLQAIGMHPDVAAANSATLGAFYGVHAERMGVLPHEFAEQYPVKFSNRALEGFDQGGDEHFTPEALKKARAPGGEVVYMTPENFLALAHPETPEREKALSIRDAIAAGKKLSDVPTLNIRKNADGSSQVDMHDGRHRARELLRQGVEQMPVRVEGTGMAEYLRGQGDHRGNVISATDLGKPFEGENRNLQDIPDRVDPQQDTRTTAKRKADSAALDALFDELSLKQESRGTFSPTTKTISVLKGADLSTFQHELGHYFLDTLTHLAAQPDAPASVKADVATLLKWGGVPDLDTWHRMSLDEQRDLHEKFATGWETYLMKGQAPTLEMRSLFSRFRSWMLGVYKGLKGAPGEFTPEVQGVFDRMIASESAIRQAEVARKYMPLFDSPEKAGMTPEQWTAYQETGRDATEQAIEKLIGTTMKDMAWMDKLRTASLKSVQRDAAEKRKVVAREVRAEVMSQPVYRAWTFLTGKDTNGLPDQVNADHVQAVRDWSEKRTEHEAQTKTALRAKAWESAEESKAEHKNPGLAKGQFLARNRARIDLDIQRAMLDYDAEHPKPKTPEKPAGSTDPTTGAGKLNTAALKEAFPDATKALQALRMTGAKGMDPGVVADMFGFSDAGALVKALTESDHPREVVDGLTDQRMLERHGEIADPAAMARTADELVHNEVRARFVATELRALNKATGPARDIAKAAKEVAGNTIDTKRIRDINEREYSAAETRAAGTAEKAMGKGDTEGAAIAKRDQLLNMELGRAARDAKEYVVKALDYLKKFDKASVRESIDLEYRDQIDALLDRADLRKSVNGTDLDKREALTAFVERMAAAGYKPQVPEGLLDEAKRWHYKDMPLLAFKGLVDSVKSIEHLGKLKESLRDGQETRRIGELAGEVKAAAAKLPQRAPESNRGLSRMQATWVKAKSFGRSAQASMLKMEQMFDWLDARSSNGVLNRVVFRRLSEAGVQENTLLAAVKSGYDELIGKHLGDITTEKKIYTAPGLIDGATGKPQRFTVKEMLMLAGNMGNESNAAKMAKGEGWDQAAVWDFLHANMTKAHWDFVSGVGKILESLWPEKLAMDRRLGNTSPEKIEPRAFDTPHGKYDGWYWPLMYDPARSQDVAERGAAKGDALFENIYSKANTDTGRMNTRNESYARPLLLDLDALPRMIKDEIHDVSHREAVIDADRFLSHPTVRKAIVDALSQEHYDQLRPWLQSIANDGKTSTDGARGMEFMNTLAREGRMRATMVGLGLRLTTAAVHGMTAGAESVAELGPKWMASGMKDFANPIQWAANKDFIFERSGEMRNRMNEVDRDVREHLREIDTRLMDPASGAAARGKDLLQAHAYSLIAGLDMASALPTWMGAYKKGLTPGERGGLGLSEQDAAYYADKTVRNAHGGTGIKDMARIQRGNEFQKLFTMFYTFWNHNINRIIDTSKLITSGEHRAAAKEASNWSDSQLAATVITRFLVYTLGVQALHAAMHPPKDGDGEESWLKWAAKEFTSAAFAGIPIARDVAAHYLTGRSYSATPAASFVDTFGNSGADVAAALTGKQVSDKWLKHSITTSGYVFNLPTGQVGGTGQFLWDVGNGDAHPDGAADWWNGIVHGDMKHR